MTLIGFFVLRYLPNRTMKQLNNLFQGQQFNSKIYQLPDVAILSKFIFTIPCCSRYISAARNTPAIIANILNNFFITNPIKNPASPPNPTVVNSGLKLVADDAAAARTLSIAIFAFTS